MNRNRNTIKKSRLSSLHCVSVEINFFFHFILLKLTSVNGDCSDFHPLNFGINVDAIMTC